MSVRRLHHAQPEAFAFTAENRAFVDREIAKYPPGRQHSAVIALLWRAQEQSGGWLPEPAIRHVAEVLDMPPIRALEIATFYTMFQLDPVGRVAHVAVCGTTPCMLRGAEDLKAICRSRIAPAQHTVSADGAFSWEEVECAGACVNAPMVQIGADTFEDLTPGTFARLLDDLAAGRRVTPGPQVERLFAAPEGGPTTLHDFRAKVVTTPTRATERPALKDAEPKQAGPAANARVKEGQPAGLPAPRGGKADDLKVMVGIGPKIERTLNELGIFHFDQIATWSPAEARWVSEHLAFPGRIEREHWVEQAQAIVAGRKS